MTNEGVGWQKTKCNKVLWGRDGDRCFHFKQSCYFNPSPSHDDSDSKMKNALLFTTAEECEHVLLARVLHRMPFLTDKTCWIHCVTNQAGRIQQYKTYVFELRSWNTPKHFKVSKNKNWPITSIIIINIVTMTTKVYMTFRRNQTVDWRTSYNTILSVF